MIHFKIISASNLPSSSKNKNCSAYVKIFPQNYDFPPKKLFAKTKTIKKTSNPEWNQEIIIPFVLFTSLKLEFWDDKSFGDELIGSTIIYFSSESFYTGSDSQIRTSNITLRKPASDSHPTFNYSYSSSLSSFDIKPAKKYEQIYAYLSFEPPLQPNQQEEVQLCVYGINSNNTLVDAISDIYTRGENEASHCGPSGPTQVYHFNFISYNSYVRNFIHEEYFFYIKNSGYSGRVTLNFVTTLNDFENKKFLNECFIFNNQWYLYVNNKNTNNHSYSVFPIKLSFNEARCLIQPITIPSDIVHQSIENKNILESIQQDNSNLFNQQFEYYSQDPDGIAVKKITDSFGKLRENFHYRFDLIPGNHYSLTEAFDYNNINMHPSKIMLGLGWDTETDLDASILQINKDGQKVDPVCYFNQSNKNQSIYTTGDNITGEGIGDDERIYIDLDKVPPTIRYLGISITSYREVPFCDINGAFCRIVDNVSKKEVMYLNLSKKENHTGLLFAVMARIDGVWDMWPCLKYFDATKPQQAQEFFEQFAQTGIIDQTMKID